MEKEDKIIEKLDDPENNEKYHEMVKIASAICDIVFKTRKTKIFEPDNPEPFPDEICRLIESFRKKMNQAGIRSDMDNLCLYGLIQNFYRRIIAKRA
jgi:hypothetical protein